MDKEVAYIPQDNDDEFVALPYYGWDQRPATLAIDDDEAATAIHLAHGELSCAASLLKVPLHRLTRLVNRTPRLQRILDESLQHTLIRAVKVPIDTLWNDEADQRAREWAARQVLTSKLAANHPLSPAAPSSSVTVNNETRSFTVIWGDGTKIAELSGSKPVLEE